ncbi:MAG: helix-turn-helix domain-containing protein [Pseudonocardiaceae bacterium]
MRDREPTMRSRELGEGLRRAMEGAGLTGVEAARRLDWSPSRVSRMLSGTRGTTEVDVAMFLTVCGVRGRERKRLLAVCQDQGVPGWLQEYGDRLPKQLVTLLDHEDKAQQITEFESTWVPGLLQTADYARALLSRSVSVPENEVEEWVAARLARQELFTRGTRARFGFFLHETALRLPVSGAAVLSDQLHHLLRMSVRPPITMRVVPSAVGAHAGIAGSFRLMEFPEFHPVVYLESETTALFLERREQVTAYRRILHALAGVALDEGHSRDLIATVAQELSADLEDGP